MTELTAHPIHCAECGAEITRLSPDLQIAPAKEIGDAITRAAVAHQVGHQN